MRSVNEILEDLAIECGCGCGSVNVTEEEFRSVVSMLKGWREVAHEFAKRKKDKHTNGCDLGKGKYGYSCTCGLHELWKRMNSLEENQ